MSETLNLDPMRSMFSGAIAESHEARKNCVNGNEGQCKVADELWSEAVVLSQIINGVRHSKADDLFSSPTFRIFGWTYFF